jgi:hypothetical protein
VCDNTFTNNAVHGHAPDDNAQISIAACGTFNQGTVSAPATQPQGTMTMFGQQHTRSGPQPGAIAWTAISHL